MKKKSKSYILGLSFLFLVGFLPSGMAYFDVGGGGSTIPRPPTLDQPISPDNDGIIILEWSKVSGCDYKVFRWNPQTEVFEKLAKVSERTYTDYRLNGTWLYRVKAQDRNTGKTSLPSNVVIVVVEVPPLQPLIGSTQRFFPQENDAKLGYTINTIHALDNPIIEFTLINNDIPDKLVNIKVYIDKEVIFSVENVNLDHDEIVPFNIPVADRLDLPIGHQIELELSHGQDIKLEYLKIEDLYFEEIIYDPTDDKNYSPLESYNYGYEQDYSVVDFDFRLHYSQDGVLNEQGTFFTPSILFYIDPGMNGPDEHDLRPLETAKYYVHSVEMNFRIICPDGSTLEDDRYAQGFGIRPSVAQIQEYSEIIHMLETFNLYINLMPLPDYLDALFDVLDLGLYYLPDYNPSISTDGVDPDTNIGYATWQTGYSSTPWGSYPNHFAYDKFSMWVNWGIDLPIQNPQTGSYQVQITWALKIYTLQTLYEYNSDFGFILDQYFHYYAFTISETSYTNFVYA